MNNLIPHFISEQYKKNKHKGLFKAYTMFVDISGFTQLTETLMKHEKDGAEVLTEALNNIFNPVVKNIFDNGGMISTFAGDAFTAIFRGRNKRVLESAIYVNKFFKDNKIIDTKYGKFEMGVKVGLSYGKVDWGILGKHGKHTYYFKGEAIDGCAESEHRANKSDIVLDNKIIEKLKIDNGKLVVKEDGYFKFKTKAVKPKPVKARSEQFKLTTKDLSPFILDAVIGFKGKAEFREVVSVFISFDKPRSTTALNEFVTQLIEGSYNYGGYFNKVDFGDKGGVALLLFGAPVSYENNIERALNFVLHLNNSINKLKFRAGITFGTVYSGIMGGKERYEYTAIGDIVNLSARFMMKAKWNKFWVSDHISENQDRTHRFNKLGKFKFRGKSGKITAYELVQKKEKGEAALFDGKIIGREVELKQLKKYTKPIFRNSFAGVTYIYGEAGIGKSRLVYELKQKLKDKVNWFYLPCENILKKSFNPVIYFLKNYF
ncbi:MAG: AAA family ATPase, partial [Candidatus Delongbacteria bacterium]|nr:AAA family ATPase [Candidatus Delongbacteria bacterium]